MSFRSASRSSPSSPASRLLNVLHRSLGRALQRECTRRYDTSATLHRLAAAEDASSMRLRLDARGLLRLHVRVRVTPAGDDLYTLHCDIEDGPSRQYSYGFSGRTGTTLSYAPELGRTVARFLLGELEKQLGRRLLRSPASPPAVPV